MTKNEHTHRRLLRNENMIKFVNRDHSTNLFLLQWALSFFIVSVVRVVRVVGRCNNMNAKKIAQRWSVWLIMQVKSNKSQYDGFFRFVYCALCFLRAVTKHTKVIAMAINPKCVSSFTANERLCACGRCGFIFFPKNIFHGHFSPSKFTKFQKDTQKNRQTKRKGTRMKSNYLQPSKTKEKGIESFERFAKEQKTIAINKNCEHFSRNVVSIQSNREKYSIFSSLSVCHCEYALVSSCGLFFSL